VDDRKSTTGVLFYLGTNPVSWSSQKQKAVAISSCEAEYMAATSGACQGIWLARLLAKMQNLEPKTVKLKVDNQSAISLCKNPVYHERTKHIDIKYHFVREKVEAGKVDVSYVRTEDQLTDILTKSHRRVRFQKLRNAIGLKG
jgi:predicted solute-binding protein